jgi:hypothetical protein
MRTVLCLIFATTVLSRVAEAQDRYAYYMGLCEQAKQAGDFPRMEQAIRQALRYGDGDEYAWRSLAWAQGRQGKWKASLENAVINVRRNGESGWSLAQYAESAIGCGEFDLATTILEEAGQLAPEARTGAEGELKACADRLAGATSIRTYQLRFTVDPGQGGPGHPPVWVLIPQRDTPLQSFTFTVRNAVSCETHSVGIRDYIEVVQKPGESFVVEGTLVLKLFCLGVGRLERVPRAECPRELRDYLDRFQNYSWWDPKNPDVQEIARTVKGRTSAETVQNVLDWFRKNIRFDASIKDDPALGQLGTILKLRYGGCHHNSGLFVTICRAAGVPACVAHGYTLPLDDKPFNAASPVGHGWAEVYLNGVGWVSVEPTDADSLRQFTTNRAYLSFGASNRPPERHHFSGSITEGDASYRLITILHCKEVEGKLTGIERPAPKTPARRALRRSTGRAQKPPAVPSESVPSGTGRSDR